MKETLCGDWSSGTDYSVGNIVRYQDVMYIAFKDPPVGDTPHDTMYWVRYNGELQGAMSAIVDVFNSAFDTIDEKIGAHFSSDGKKLTLASSTASSVKNFDITVDDDGELTATEVTPS